LWYDGFKGAGKMNKIIKKHYPVERLPADLRSGLRQDGWVRIEIEPEAGEAPAPVLSPLVGTGRNVHGAPDDVITHIRSLRDDR
jgi:hypothetical protein